MLSPITLKFLEAVKIHNHTSRMHANKELYLQEKNRFLALIEEVLAQMKDIDPRLEEIQAKDCMYRFNKDIRFSKDKSPYKTRFGAFMSMGGRKSPLPGYYIHIDPEGSLLGGGSRCPDPQQKENIKLHILRNREERCDIVEKAGFRRYFGEVDGKDTVDLARRLKSKSSKAIFEQLGTTKTQNILKNPKALEMFLYCRWVVDHPLTEEEVLSPDLADILVKGFKKLKLFNDFIFRGF